LPLDAAAEVSFAVHMAQQLLLIVVAGRLIVLGNGGVAMLSALPARLRVPLGRAVASPWLRRLRTWLFSVPVTTAVHGLMVWLWHTRPPCTRRRSPIRWCTTLSTSRCSARRSCSGGA
jgi:cytochrome c oxidase assembly factor CtaG